MITYRTGRSNSLYFFKQLLITIVIFSLPIIYDLLFSTTFIRESYYWVAAALILMRIIDERSKERLTEIRFNTDARQVIFIYTTLFSAPQQKTLSFDSTRVEITQSKSSWTWLREPLILYFLNNKKEVFELNKSKDGFSVETLKEISKTVEDLSLPH